MALAVEQLARSERPQSDSTEVGRQRPLLYDDGHLHIVYESSSDQGHDMLNRRRSACVVHAA